MKAIGYIIESTLFIFIFTFSHLSLSRVYILGKADNYGSLNSQKSRLTSISLAAIEVSSLVTGLRNDARSPSVQDN